MPQARWCLWFRLASLYSFSFSSVLHQTQLVFSLILLQAWPALRIGLMSRQNLWPLVHIIFLGILKKNSLTYAKDLIHGVYSYKYLGVLFDPCLSWCNHVNSISSRISKRIGLIRRIKFFSLPISTLNKLDNVFVMPHFDYCSSVWSNCNVQYANNLQFLQNRLVWVLVSADIRTRIIDLMNTVDWNKFDKNGSSAFFLQLSNVWRGCSCLFIISIFSLQLILIISGVKLLILWFHLGK